MGATHQPHIVSSEAELRAIIGEMPAAATLKIADHVNGTLAGSPGSAAPSA